MIRYHHLVSGSRLNMKISRENETNQINKQAKQNKIATTEHIRPDKLDCFVRKGRINSELFVFLTRSVLLKGRQGFYTITKEILKHCLYPTQLSGLMLIILNSFERLPLKKGVNLLTQTSKLLPLAFFHVLSGRNLRTTVAIAKGDPTTKEAFSRPWNHTCGFHMAFKWKLQDCEGSA